MFGTIRDFFAAPARQALGWAALGILGIGFAALGVLLILGSDGASTVPVSALASPTPTKTATTAAPSPSPSATASPSATPSPAPTPVETPTAAPAPTRAASTGGGGASFNPTPVPPAPTPEPTPEPVVTAGGPYCNTVSSNAPPNSIFGLLRLGGADAPAGTSVTMLFDGVPGPSAVTTAAGGYKVNWAAGGSECANRVGAAITIAVNGTVYASPASVGGGNPAIRFDIDVP